MYNLIKQRRAMCRAISNFEGHCQTRDGRGENRWFSSSLRRCVSAPGELPGSEIPVHIVKNTLFLPKPLLC